MKPAGVFQYYQNSNVRETGQGEAMERKYTVRQCSSKHIPPAVTQPTVEPRLFSSQRFGKHIFVMTNHVRGFPWMRASLYKEPCRLFRAYQCGGGVNTSTVTLRVVGGNERSLESETVKYGRESQGTRTRERLYWQGPPAYTKDRPVLSSERVSHEKKTVTV
jgi:hypothetical protein